MAVAPYDDEEIDDGDRLVRRVNPRHHVVPDGNTGGERLSTKLFSPSSDPDGGMSVNLLEPMISDEIDFEEFLKQPPYIAAVQFRAEVARQNRMMVGKDPIDDEDKPNPYHGQVWSTGDRPNRFSTGKKNALMKASEWLIEIPDVKIG